MTLKKRGLRRLSLVLATRKVRCLVCICLAGSVAFVVSGAEACWLLTIVSTACLTVLVMFCAFIQILRM